MNLKISIEKFNEQDNKTSRESYKSGDFLMAIVHDIDKNKDINPELLDRYDFRWYIENWRGEVLSSLHGPASTFYILESVLLEEFISKTSDMRFTIKVDLIERSDINELLL